MVPSTVMAEAVVMQMTTVLLLLLLLLLASVRVRLGMDVGVDVQQSRRWGQRNIRTSPVG